MERILVVVFDSRDKADEGSRALQELDDEALIALYESAIIVKDAAGATTVVETRHEMAEGTLDGTAIGTLIGLLAGPMGLAVGAAGGLLVGAAADLARFHIGQEFVNDVKKALEPGKAAVVAEIDEELTDDVDTRMKSLGGVVFRRDHAEVAHSELKKRFTKWAADRIDPDAYK
jgi:uncharacterized membrane protein